MKERPGDPYKIVGTLPDWAIREHIRDGVIKIDPLTDGWERRIDPVTVDFHLGHHLRFFKRDGHDTIDTKYSTRDDITEMMQFVGLQEGQPFVLTSEDFVIATTLERLTLPDNIIGHLHGKSSLARLGIVVHSTAARFDPGWDGNPVLEFGTFLSGKKILLYSGRPICAFSFERMAEGVERKYMEKANRSFGGSSDAEVSNIAQSGIALVG